MMSVSEKYKSLVDSAVQKKLVDRNSVFDPTGTDHEDYYLSLFDFFQGYLDTEFKGHIIQSPHFILVNDITVNAHAKANKNGSLIGLNHGAAIILKRIYDDLPGIIAHNSMFASISSLFESDSEKLYQLAQLSIFYHEAGHLIQFKKKSNRLDELDEMVKSDKFFFEQHMMEFDADTYSATQIVRHIFKLYEAKKGSCNSDCLSSLVGLVVGIIFNYKSYYYQSLDFYEKEKSHPHGLVRLLNLVTVINEYASQYFEEKGIGFDSTNTAQKSILSANLLARELHGIKKAQILGTAIDLHMKDAAAYAKELQVAIRDDSNSATRFTR